MVNYTPSFLKRETEVESQTNRSASDIITKSVLTLKPDMNIVEAAGLIESHEVSGAPVVSDNGKLVGYLSEKDCLKFILDIKYYNQGGGTVDHYMAKTIMTIDPNESLLYIAELFISNHFHVYPVVDSDGILLGVVTRARLFCEMNHLKQTSWAA